MCLIFNEIAIVMGHEKCDFKNWTFPKTFRVSLSDRSQKFGDNEFSNFLKYIKMLLKKLKSRRFCNNHYRNQFFQLNFSSEIW